MKIIHSLGGFFPDSSAGTEVYVESLIKNLENYSEIENSVVSPVNNDSENKYHHNNILVYRYPINEKPGLGVIKGLKPHGGFEYFKKYLILNIPDVYHQHSWVTGCGIHHLRYAKQIGLKTVLTVHVPGYICLRGTMLLNGEQVCDGKVELTRCGSCWLKSKGLNLYFSQLFSQIPLNISNIFNSRSLNSKFITAMSTISLVKDHRNRLKELEEITDKIIVVSNWLYDAMIINGISEDKLYFNRQGLPYFNNNDLSKSANNNKTLKICFLGRWNKVKGIHMICEVISLLPKDADITLDIFGLVGDSDEQKYKSYIIDKFSSDKRINFCNAIERNNLLTTISKFDLLAVPSQGFETGPLTILEAHAAKLPVIGSNIGGIAELVHNNIDGILLPFNNAQIWVDTIYRLYKNRNIIDGLRNNIKPVRTMKDVADEMYKIYNEI